MSINLSFSSKAKNTYVKFHHPQPICTSICCVPTTRSPGSPLPQLPSTSPSLRYLIPTSDTVKVYCLFHLCSSIFSDNLVKQLSDALNARELIKIHVLENCELTPREASDELSDTLSAIPVQTIGRKIVLYRQSEDEKKRTIVVK